MTNFEISRIFILATDNSELVKLVLVPAVLIQNSSSDLSINFEVSFNH